MLESVISKQQMQPPTTTMPRRLRKVVLRRGCDIHTNTVVSNQRPSLSQPPRSSSSSSSSSSLVVRSSSSSSCLHHHNHYRYRYPYKYFFYQSSSSNSNSNSSSRIPQRITIAVRNSTFAITHTGNDNNSSSSSSTHKNDDVADAHANDATISTSGTSTTIIPPPWVTSTLTPTYVVKQIGRLLQKPLGSFVYPSCYRSSKIYISCIIDKSATDGTPNKSNSSNRTTKTTAANSTLWYTKNTVAINDAFRLWERNVKEYSIYLALQQQQQPKEDEIPFTLWFCRSRMLNALFCRWKDAAIALLHTTKSTDQYHIRDKPTIQSLLVSPRQLVQSLERMSILLPLQQFQFYDIATMNMIMHVLVAQAPTKQQAPFIAEQLLDYIRAESTTTTTTTATTTRNDSDHHHHDNQSNSKDHQFRLTRLLYTYGVVIKAWIDSGLPETSAKIESLLQEYYDTATVATTIAPSPMECTDTTSNSSSQTNDLINDNRHTVTLVPCMMVMRHYAQSKQFHKVKEIYYTMKNERSEWLTQMNSMEFLSHLLYCAIQCHEIECMEFVFSRMVDVVKETARSSATTNTDAVTTGNSTTENTDPTNQPSQKESYFDVGAHHLVLYYRDQIKTAQKRNYYNSNRDRLPNKCTDHASNTINNIVENYFNKAQYTYQCMEEFSSNHAAIVRMRNMMLDIYGYIGRIELVEDIFQNVISKKEPDAISYNTVIKAYGICQSPAHAEAIVHQMFGKESSIKPTIRTMNTLMQCWTDSLLYSSSSSMYHKSDNNTKVALEHVYHWFHWIKTNHQCIDLNIQPDRLTYATVLKCIVIDAMAASKAKTPRDKYSNSDDRFQINTNIVEKVESLLQEMDDRCIGGNVRCTPDVRIYINVMKALILANDYIRAEQILQRMEDSLYPNRDKVSSANTHGRNNNDTSNFGLRPTRDVYELFFNYYAGMRSIHGAKRAEKLHNHMRSLSHDMSDPEIAPNSFTYRIIFDAYVQSGDSKMTMYLWSLYDQMSRVDKIDVGRNTYAILINALSYSNRSLDNRLLMEVLQHVHKHPVKDMIGIEYCVALKNSMWRWDVALAAQVMCLIVDSYKQGKFTCHPSDRPDRAKFNWIISTFVASNELESAIMFLEDIIRPPAVSSHSVGAAGDRGTLDLSWIGPDLSTMIDLRKAWTENTTHLEKKEYLSKLDTELIPAMVRSLNIEKGNTQQQQIQATVPGL